MSAVTANRDVGRINTEVVIHARVPIKVSRGRTDDTPDMPDLRFRALLGEDAWSRLPHAVQHRFSRRLAAGSAVTYAGEIVESSMTVVGWLLAQLCRVIGAPLPLNGDVGVPAVVTVTEDIATGGQFWTRIYGRNRRFPQVIHSSKRFAGSTGLEEYLGRGFGIALTVSADGKALHFHSAHYFLILGFLRLRLPRWLEPGALTISHVDCGEGRFAFVLQLRHRLFGEVMRQTCMFRERFVRDDAEVVHGALLRSGVADAMANYPPATPCVST